VTTVKANTDTNYQQLRQQAKGSGDFGGPFATVNNLVIKRDAGVFTLKSGEIYFTPAVKDRTFGAVFFGEGELSLTPPTEIEKHTLSRSRRKSRSPKLSPNWCFTSPTSLLTKSKRRRK